jgi:hypothetical protein
MMGVVDEDGAVGWISVPVRSELLGRAGYLLIHSA